jgi:hypothetical protein
MKRIILALLILAIPCVAWGQTTGGFTGYYGPTPPTYLIYDTFTGTSSLDAHSPGVGGAWVETSGDWSVSGGYALKAANAYQIASIDSGVANYTAESTVNSHTGGAGLGIAVRIIDTSNHFICVADVTTINAIIFKKTDGSFSDVGHVAKLIPADTDTLVRVVTSGNTITFTVDGASASYSSATQGNTSTLVGLSSYFTTDKHTLFTVVP